MTRLLIVASFFWLAVAVLPAQLGAAGLQGGKRFALVMGNSDYPGPSIPGTSDARAMAAALEGIGFTVVGGTASEKAVLDGSLDVMTDGLKALAKAIQDSGTVPDVVLFYYSGHGFQVGGTNYLLPAKTSDLKDPKTEAISLKDVVNTYMAIGDVYPNYASKIVILDACRTNETLQINGKAPDSGLTQDQFHPPPQTLVFYATGYGNVADGTAIDGHSPFTYSILLYIGSAGLELSDFQSNVVVDTRNHTRPEQTPTPYGSIPSPFFFRPPVEIEVAITQVDDGVFVLSGTNTATRWIDEPEVRKTFYLHSGKNPLSILVFNQKTYHNSQSWDKPEGWAYEVELAIPGLSVQAFGNHEPVPRKNGPRFGKLFSVVTATLTVDPMSSAVSVQDPWEIDLPPEENEDKELYRVPLFGRSLVIGGREALGAKVNQCVGEPFYADALWSLISGGNPDDVLKKLNDDFSVCVGDSVWMELE